VIKVCQAVGKCFLEDPLAEEKDTIWQARWFVKKHPTGAYQDLEAYLKERNAFIPPQTLKEVVSNALSFLEERSRGPIRQQEYKKILALLSK
jgi:hypothetical protein